MRLKAVKTVYDWKTFFDLPLIIYKGNVAYRHTETEVARLVVQGPTVFHKYSTVLPYLFVERDAVVGRCALIQDKRKADTIQIAFFEAFPGLTDPLSPILLEIRLRFPGITHFTVGLNGHINYSAGFLATDFHKPSCFGLPYTQAYYHDYFKRLKAHLLYAFSFPVQPFLNLLTSEKTQKVINHAWGFQVRTLNKRRMSEEVKIYTSLNNACFVTHPLWVPRTAEEDYELFHPFRFLLQSGNMLFLEKAGKPIGFFLWYPDFNALVKPHELLSLKHVLEFKLMNPIKTFRFTQIGILPEYQTSPGILALITAAAWYIKREGYTQGEGGFIFAENTRSMRMTEHFIERACGLEATPDREYRIYEGVIS